MYPVQSPRAVQKKHSILVTLSYTFDRMKKGGRNTLAHHQSTGVIKIVEIKSWRLRESITLSLVSALMMLVAKTVVTKETMLPMAGISIG